MSTLEELDGLLDRIDAEARRLGRPQNVELTVDGAGTLGIVLGHDRSVLNHIPSDLDPPYLASLGAEDQDRAFTFYVRGDHHTESHWRHTVPAGEARDAARVFLLTEALDDRVRWDVV
ncbi:MAG: Imm1 family immunity protein [Thermoleophilaceae bacterium]